MERFETAVRSALVACALSLIASSAQAAGGMNLSWSDCGVFGQAQRSFDCASNAGVNVLYVSAVTPAPMPQLNGMAAVIDLQTNAAVLSPWWQLQNQEGATGCRTGFLSSNYFFPAGPFSCLDPWWGVAAGGFDYKYQFGLLNRGRLRAVCAVWSPSSSDGESEYYMGSLAIRNMKTVGVGACGGCADGVCLVLNSVLVAQPYGMENYTITNPLNRQYVTWQSGGASPGPGRYGSGCPGATPARSSTWGSVKALYR